MNRNLLPFVLGSALWLSPLAARAQTAGPVGQIISYQGQLTSAGGAAVADGAQSLTFSIQEAGSNTALFNSTQSVATVGGVFNTFLGVGSFVFDPAKSYSLSVTFEGKTSTHPIAAVPVALTAKSAASVSGIVPISNGGTGSATKNFVDTTTAQTVAGAKTFAGALEGRNGLLLSGNTGSTPVSGSGIRLMWVPEKSALRAGRAAGSQWDDTNIGNTSFAAGESTIASGSISTAMGSKTIASASSSTAMGSGTLASGKSSTALGQNTTAGGTSSTAMGQESTATGLSSAAIGFYTNASGDFSVALGDSSTASGTGATAMGTTSRAYGIGSTAMGYNSEASGYASTASGSGSTASGGSSTAMGGKSTASGTSSVAMGGNSNASGNYSTAIGFYNSASGINSTAIGSHNSASGRFSTALGSYATTNDFKGSFVYGDNSSYYSEMVSASAENQATWRTSGGFRIFTNTDLTTGVSLAPGQGSWSTLSDRSVKDSLRAIDSRDVLRRVSALPLSSWQYKGTSSRHIGPMAQDFRTAFGLGQDEKHIDTVDADGVALAAIQGLNAELKDRDTQIAALKAQNAAFEARLKKLETGLSSSR